MSMNIDKLWFRWDDAVAVGGSDKAIILEFVRWSCEFKEADTSKYAEEYHVDGHWWMRDSMKAWTRRLPWLSERTIRRYLKDLVADGYLDIKRSINSHGGADANMYRVMTKCETPSSNLPPLQNCKNPPSHDASTPPRKLDTPSSTNIHTKNLANTHTSPTETDNTTSTEVAVYDPDDWKIPSKPYPRRAPKDYTPSEAHKRLCEVWKLHMGTNSPNGGKGYTDRDYAYWMALLLNQDLTPKPTEEMVIYFCRFLEQRMDANRHWEGWGKVLQSIPAATVRKDGVSKLEKAWSSFASLFAKKLKQHQAATKPNIVLDDGTVLPF